MIRDITIGQYYPANSVLHRLDPRVKIVGTLLFLISLFVQKSVLGYLVATVFLAGVIHLSKVPFRFIMKGLKPIMILLLITVGFNLFLNTGGKVLVHFWIFKITEAGVEISVYMAIRLIYLIAGSSLMTFTTTPNALTDGIEKLLRPLNKVKVPVHEVAMMMSIALRFIPILLEETDKIMKAQIARGADLESGKRSGSGKWKYHPEGESNDPDPGATICLSIPACQRPCHGNGGTLLSGRRRQDEDEAAGISQARSDGIWSSDMLSGSDPCAWQNGAVSHLDILK